MYIWPPFSTRRNFFFYYYLFIYYIFDRFLSTEEDSPCTHKHALLIQITRPTNDNPPRKTFYILYYAGRYYTYILFEFSKYDSPPLYYSLLYTFHRMLHEKRNAKVLTELNWFWLCAHGMSSYKLNECDYGEIR